MDRRTFLPLLGTALVGASCLSTNASDFGTIHTPGLLLPKRLKPGDTIGITAPAAPIRHHEEIENFQKILEELGFNSKVGMVAERKYGYLSAPDDERAADFMMLVQDPEVDAIFFIRGGWGCARLVDLLDYEIIANHPKIIMGFSDITTLLNAITARTGLVTFHGPGGNSSWNDYSVEYVRDLLVNGQSVKYQNHDVNDLEINTYSGGTAEGQLFGGNLSVISSLIGSKYLPDWTDKILFLEDVSEEPYRIDRMLTHLKLAGVFDSIAGLVLGTFTKCEPEDPDRSFPVEELFRQHFENIDFPVYYGAQFGHTRHKYTLPVGPRVKLNADQGSLELLEKCVV